MLTAPSPTSVALLLGLSFFLGLAFEDFFARAARKRPGGIRTFPMLALAGGGLYLLDPTHVIAFTAGLLVLGAWLIMYYRSHLAEADETGETKASLIVPLLNMHAYLLGAVALALPPWVAVTTTVVAVLLLTGRTWLHDLARRIDMSEIVTAGQFLILTGIILPLLPNEPVTTLTAITPRQVWLALVVVCTFSYVSYLAQRYWAAAAGGLWMAALGGLYSSTATTVVLARQAKADPAIRRHAQAGITLATAIMYLRILAITAIFNMALARRLALPLIGLSAAGLVICALQYWVFGSSAHDQPAPQEPANLRLEPQSAGAWRGDHICGAVRRDLIPLDLGDQRVRRDRHLFARRDRRHFRYRSVRPQPGARRIGGRVGDDAGRRHPDRRVVQQYPQGLLRRVLCRRPGDRGKRGGARGPCHSRRCRRADDHSAAVVAGPHAGTRQRIDWSL